MGRELPQGRRVGNYAVERLLQRGGLSTTYQARQARTDRICTLTVFHLDPDMAPWAQLRRELEQLDQLRHPGLVEVLDLGVSHDGTPFLVTEQLAGEDLGARFLRSGALTLSEALMVGRQVGAALHAGHGIGVVHRDVRPENIFVTDQARGGEVFLRVKLLGAGLARLLESTVGSLALVGHPEYLAPEQVLGHSADVDPRADQYALAVVLYQGLTTSRPFRGDSVAATLLRVTRGEAEPLRALRPDVPHSVEAAIARAMHRDREARFPDMPAFLRALQEGVPLPVAVAEMTEPWLVPPVDLEEARRLVLATGGAPAAPLSIGVSAALEAAQRSGPSRLGSDHPPEPPAPPPGEPAAEGQAAVPEALAEAPATVPHSMQDVMQLAVPPPEPVAAEADATVRTAVDGAPETSVEEELSGSSLEIVAEYTEDGRQGPRAGETEVVTRPSREQEQLPSIIVDLPTRPIIDGDRLPPGVAAPNDETRVQAHQRGEPPQVLVKLLQQLERRAPLAERLGWALAGACAGGLLMRLLS